MSKTNIKKLNSKAAKKWLTLGVVAAALLLIPRRSSRQDMMSSKDLAATEDFKSAHTSNKNAHGN